MTVEETLKQAQIDRLDAEVLLGYVLHKNRTWLMANPKEELAAVDQADFDDLVSRRLQNEPVAHLTGLKEFYGREFIITKHVLIPRTSTEGLVTAALDMIKTGNTETLELDTEVVAYRKIFKPLGDLQLIVEVGTGSGCVAICLALELPEFEFIATDLSSEALAVAKKNATLHKVADRIEFKEGDLLSPINGLEEPFLLVSNPPYIPDSEDLMPEVVDYEPKGALFGGPDGGDLVRKIIAGAPQNPACRGICLECRADQVLQ